MVKKKLIKVIPYKDLFMEKTREQYATKDKEYYIKYCDEYQFSIIDDRGHGHTFSFDFAINRFHLVYELYE